MAACAPSSQRTPTDGAVGVGQQPPATKTLRLGVTQEPSDGIALFASSGGNGVNVTFAFHAGLTVYDQQGTLLPNIASKVPSIDDGDWKVLPDGTMEVAWKLRPDVVWHDGTPLTAGDFVFGLTVQQDPETPAKANTGVKLISRAVAVDQQTLVLTWKETYAEANASGPTDIIAIPRHIMGDAYQGGDKQLFYNSTYWARAFVGLGPYRINAWESGSHIEAAAFDQYFLGRPKIDRLIIRYFSDVKTLVSSLLAGDTDVAGVSSVGLVEGASLRQQWSGGDVLPALTSFRYGTPQDRDPTLPWVRDVRVRQALIHMIDRQAIVDSLTYGLSMTADTAIALNDPAFRLLEQRGFARYPYDLARAGGLLNDAGWRRGGDGIYQNGGEPLSITIASPARQDINVQEVVAIASEWKSAGLAATPDPIPYNSVNLNELKASVHGVFLGSNDLIAKDHFGSFTTAQLSSAANRFSAANKGGYSNAVYDRLFDEFSTALDPNRRRDKVVEMAKMGADEAIWIPFYYGSDIASVRKGVRGVGTAPAVQGATTWNIHTWDVD